MRRRAVLLGGLATIGAAAADGDFIALELAGGRCLVPVVLDGRPARLLLDTGAERTIMAAAAVARLGLRRDGWVGTTLRDATGRLERHANVDVAMARAGGVRLSQGLPGGGLSLPVSSDDLAGADGLLGGDILRHFSVDLDFSRARLMLRPAGDATPGTVRLQTLRGDLLLAPLRLDGHALTALVDTGASVSLLNARGLYRLGLDAAPSHRFGALQIGALRVPDPILLTLDVAAAGYDLVLGLDVLGRRRFIVSYQRLVLGFD